MEPEQNDKHLGRVIITENLPDAEPVALFRMPPKLDHQVLEKMIQAQANPAPSDLKITITLVNEPHVIVDDYVITQDEFDSGSWKEDLIRIVEGAISWERLSRRPKNANSKTSSGVDGSQTSA